jgi:hypothetical protein
MAELQIPTKIIGLKLLLLQILGFAVSALLTFCYRNPPLNGARGCAPGIARNARLFWFCKQPLEAGENIRDVPDSPRTFCGRRMRKNDQKIAGLAAASPQFVVGALRRKWCVRNAARSASTAAGQPSIPSPVMRPSIVDRQDRLCFPLKYT